MSNKHTPGPWEPGYGEDSKAFGIFTKQHLESGVIDHPICLISPQDKVNDQDKANAELIASAPALKEENEKLKEALEVIKKMTDNSAIRIKINQALNQTK